MKIIIIIWLLSYLKCLIIFACIDRINNIKFEINNTFKYDTFNNISNSNSYIDKFNNNKLDLSNSKTYTIYHKFDNINNTNLHQIINKLDFNDSYSYNFDLYNSNINKLKDLKDRFLINSNNYYKNKEFNNNINYDKIFSFKMFANKTFDEHSYNDVYSYNYDNNNKLFNKYETPSYYKDKSMQFGKDDSHNILVDKKENILYQSPVFYETIIPISNHDNIQIYNSNNNNSRTIKTNLKNAEDYKFITDKHNHTYDLLINSYKKDNNYEDFFSTNYDDSKQNLFYIAKLDKPVELYNININNEFKNKTSSIINSNLITNSKIQEKPNKIATTNDVRNKLITNNMSIENNVINVLNSTLSNNTNIKINKKRKYSYKTFSELKTNKLILNQYSKEKCNIAITNIKNYLNFRKFNNNNNNNKTQKISNSLKREFDILNKLNNIDKLTDKEANNLDALISKEKNIIDNQNIEIEKLFDMYLYNINKTLNNMEVNYNNNKNIIDYFNNLNNPYIKKTIINNSNNYKINKNDLKLSKLLNDVFEDYNYINSLIEF